MVIVTSKYVEIAKSTFQKVGGKIVTGHRIFLKMWLVKGNIVCNLSEKRLMLG